MGTKQKQLLIDIISEVGTGVLSPDMRDRVNEFIADGNGCAFCDKPATLLCDYVLGYLALQYRSASAAQAKEAGQMSDFVPFKGLPVKTAEGRMTCDAPMCRECAKHESTIFFCGKDGGLETVDICPHHADMKRSKASFITATEAKEMRAAVVDKCPA